MKVYVPAGAEENNPRAPSLKKKIVSVPGSSDGLKRFTVTVPTHDGYAVHVLVPDGGHSTT